MDKKNLQKLYYSIHDYVLILFGLILYTFGWTGFILSNEIVTGGVTGICALIFFATGIPVSLSYIAINVVLLAIAFKIFGGKFLIKTIFGVVSLSLLLMAGQWFFTKPILNEQPFMSIVIGSMFCGIGIGMVFSGSGSTGGTDIIAAIVNKYKHVSIGKAMIICDFFIIGSSYFLFHSIDKVVFGMVEMLICNYMLDFVFNGSRQSIQLLIFSRQYAAIADKINSDLGRGCTVLDGTGWYSKEPVKVIVLVAKKTESITIFRIVKNIDHQAFISQANVQGVYGEGFDQIKT